MSKLLKIVSMGMKVATLVKVSKEFNKLVPQETQAKVKKAASAAVEKGKDLAIQGLENYAPDVVKEIVGRNAPEQATAQDIAAEVIKQMGKKQKTAAKTPGTNGSNKAAAK